MAERQNTYVRAFYPQCPRISAYEGTRVYESPRLLWFK